MFINAPKRMSLLLALVALACSYLSANEITAVWERIYRQSVSDEQRYAVMLKIMELKDKDFAPLISESLDKLFVSKIESADPSVTRTKIALAKLLVQELGNLRSADDAELVLNVYRDVKDPFLRSEAAVSLGKMRATDTVEILARDLSDLNLKPDQANPRPKEILAYGLVQALDLMHSPAGFEPVFFASLGWYSGLSQVKESARAVLKTMIADPVPQLKQIIVKDADYGHKLMALDAAIGSTAPAESKNEIARIALDQGLNAHENDPQLKARLTDIRMRSIKMLVDNKDTAPATVALYRKILDNRESLFDEILVTYAALGKNASKDAVAVLVQRMDDFNNRQKSGKNTPDDRKLIMQILASIKETRSSEARPVLVEAQFSNHDGTVARTAREVAESLP
jgi:HEAT repeat protein